MKLNIVLPYYLVTLFLRIYSPDLKTCRNLNADVYSSFIHDCQKLGAYIMTFNRWVNKLVYPYKVNVTHLTCKLTRWAATFSRILGKDPHPLFRDKALHWSWHSSQLEFHISIGSPWRQCRAAQVTLYMVGTCPYIPIVIRDLLQEDGFIIKSNIIKTLITFFLYLYFPYFFSLWYTLNNNIFIILHEEQSW